MQSVMEEEQREEVTVNLDCLCGNNQITDSMVIRCDQCGVWFHTDCMQLGMTCIEELEREELDWVCTLCIEEAVNNPDMTNNFVPYTPGGKFEQDSRKDGSCDDVNDTDGHISYMLPPHYVECSVGSPIPTTYSTIVSTSTAISSLQTLVSPNPISSLQTLVSPNPISSLQTLLSPNLLSTPEKPRSPTSSHITTSLLSLTAQLEEHHLATADTMQDVSLMFIKPAAPPIKRQAKKAPPAKVEEVQLKPGKSWRRSLCQAKRTASLAASFAQPRLDSLAEDRLSVMVANKMSLGTNLSSLASFTQSPRPDPYLSNTQGINTTSPPLPGQQRPRLDSIESEEFILPTPQKILANPRLPSLFLARSLSRTSRTSFCIVPSTPRPDRLGVRLSVMPLLSETLQTDEKKLSQILPETLEPDSQPQEAER